MSWNGTLLAGDIEIAKIRNGRVHPIKKELMPFYLLRQNDFAGWLEGRAIDSHRTNSRLLKKALRLTTEADAELVLHVNAATITDNYWFRPDGAAMEYSDVLFRENVFDQLALCGDPDSFNRSYSRTPELTNIGSFEKCWRRIDGEWWIYKQGNDLEQFSELFIYHFGQELGFYMAEYEKAGPYIRSRDFTRGKVNYESMDGLVGEDENYKRNYQTLKDLCPTAAREYLQMIYLDTLCFNMDRHTRNYGVLRDRENGEVLRMAPNYDNNIALIARGYPKNVGRENDKLIELFLEFLSECPEAQSEFKLLRRPVISEELLRSCLLEVPIEVDGDFVCRFILNGTERILERLGYPDQGLEMNL